VESARPATTADLARLVELAYAMRVELEEERGGPLWATREARAEPIDDAFAALLAREDAALLVGTYDDAVVGFGAAHVEVLRDGSRLGVVDEIYVEPEARAVGVGETLVARLVDFCRAAGCAGVDATALPGDREAKNFFERAGFSARLLVMHKSL
jgi:ribosomal protein S18 acetylase RimI-like enzyme